MVLRAVLLMCVIIFCNASNLSSKKVNLAKVIISNNPHIVFYEAHDADDVCSLVAISVLLVFTTRLCETKQRRIIYVLCLIILRSKSR